MKQKLLGSPYIERLKRRVKSTLDVELYIKDDFEIDQIYVHENSDIEVPDKLDLVMPTEGDNHDFENSKIIFESMKNMNPTTATDYRIWTYLTHGPMWKYMRKRSPVEKQQAEKRPDYIIRHWFVDNIGTRELMRNNASSLWWCAYLTYERDRDDPYELTAELYSMLDYTRHLLPGKQGRNKNFVHALLEFVIENRSLFEHQKEARVRFLMRKANYIAGYRVFPSLSKDEIKLIFSQYKDSIRNIPKADK